MFESHIPGYPCRRGKVRDVYDLGDRLVIVATDRISAFDWVLPTPIPDKGFLLTGLSCFLVRSTRRAESSAESGIERDGCGLYERSGTRRPCDARQKDDGRSD